MLDQPVKTNGCSEIQFLQREFCWEHKHWVKSVQIRSYFWSVFSCVRTEYGDLRSKVRIQENLTRNNSVFGHFSRSEKILKIKCRKCIFSLKSLELSYNQNPKIISHHSLVSIISGLKIQLSIVPPYQIL